MVSGIHATHTRTFVLSQIMMGLLYPELRTPVVAQMNSISIMKMAD